RRSGGAPSPSPARSPQSSRATQPVHIRPPLEPRRRHRYRHRPACLPPRGMSRMYTTPTCARAGSDDAVGGIHAVRDYGRLRFCLRASLGVPARPRTSDVKKTACSCA
ncbi:Plexin-D1, partial [Frankliniella fusca]